MIYYEKTVANLIKMMAGDKNYQIENSRPNIINQYQNKITIH